MWKCECLLCLLRNQGAVVWFYFMFHVLIFILFSKKKLERSAALLWCAGVNLSFFSVRKTKLCLFMYVHISSIIIKLILFPFSLFLFFFHIFNRILYENFLLTPYIISAFLLFFLVNHLCLFFNVVLVAYSCMLKQINKFLIQEKQKFIVYHRDWTPSSLSSFY